jgi:hypothetical protein
MGISRCCQTVNAHLLPDFPATLDESRLQGGVHDLDGAFLHARQHVP